MEAMLVASRHINSGREDRSISPKSNFYSGVNVRKSVDKSYWELGKTNRGWAR